MLWSGNRSSKTEGIVFAISERLSATGLWSLQEIKTASLGAVFFHVQFRLFRAVCGMVCGCWVSIRVASARCGERGHTSEPQRRNAARIGAQGPYAISRTALVQGRNHLACSLGAGVRYCVANRFIQDCLIVLLHPLNHAAWLCAHDCDV